MAGRIIYILTQLLVALLLLATAAGALGMVYLGLFQRPPYAQWLRTGASGVAASTILLVGTVLWGLLAVGALFWTRRSVARAWRAVRGS